MSTNERPAVTVRIYLAGVLVGEEELAGPLSTKQAKSGKRGGK